MNDALNPFSTLQGYEAPHVTQYSVFLDNKVGKLLEIMRAFEHDHTCQIVSLCIIESSDHAVVRIITNNARCAKRVLRENSFSFSELEVLVVRLEDDHSILSMCATLMGAELNIHFMYPLLWHDYGGAFALAVDDPTFAGQVLRRKQYTMLGEGDFNT
ncbi:MAG: acetolactate synthase [Planctomycetota bacterium]|jgi:hypothetical protein